MTYQCDVCGKSEKGKLLQEIDKVYRIYFIKDKPHICQWCRRPCENLNISHILPKGAYPKLRYFDEIILLLCYHCHMHRWHKSPLEAASFAKSILGDDYKEKLLIQNAIQPKHNMVYLQTLRFYYEQNY